VWLRVCVADRVAPLSAQGKGKRTRCSVQCLKGAAARQELAGGEVWLWWRYIHLHREHHGAKAGPQYIGKRRHDAGELLRGRLAYVRRATRGQAERREAAERLSEADRARWPSCEAKTHDTTKGLFGKWRIQVDGRELKGILRNFDL
jgi:hypothetical protein